MQVLIAGDTNGRWAAWLSEWGYEPVVAADVSAATERLMSSTGPLIALLMPGVNSVDAEALCRTVRSEPGLRYVFVIRPEQSRDAEAVAMLLRAGADEVLPATVEPRELEQRVAVGRRIAELQLRYAEANELLRVRATTDSLTGLCNRAEILRMLERELNRMHRHGSQLSVLMIDVDFFKKINDEHGHPAGDEVLRSVAGVLQRSMRSYDEIGRYGGEEFIAILPETNLNQSLLVAERIRASVKDTPVQHNQLRFNLTISVGVVTSFDATDSPRQLIERADLALYAAKQSGRNCVCGFPNEMPQRAETILAID